MSNMKERIYTDKKAITVLLLLLSLQIILMCYWQTQKQNYYIDELYSMQYANYETDPNRKITYLQDMYDWKDHIWAEADEMKETLILSADESLSQVSPVEQLKLFWNRRNYFYLLNRAESAFQIGELTGRGGFILNLLLFLPTQILLYLIVCRLTGSTRAGLLCVSLFGFSLFAIFLTLYVRFYMFVLFLLTGALFLHILIWEMSEFRPLRQAILEGIAFFLLLLAFKNSELICLFGPILVGGFCVLLLLERRIYAMLEYIAPVLFIGVPYFKHNSGGVYDVIAHPENYIHSTSYAKHLVSNAFLNASLQSVTDHLKTILQHLAEQFCGSRWLALCWILLLPAGTVFVFCTNHGTSEKRTENQSAGLFGKNPEKRSAGLFAAMLAAAGVLYIFCMALINCVHYRYSAWTIPCLLIPVCCLSAYTESSTWKKEARILLTLLVIITAVQPFLHRDRNELIYQEDKEILATLEHYSDVDILCDISNEHLLYDAAVNAGSGVRMMDCSREHSEDGSVWESVQLPDSLLLFLRTGDASYTIEEHLTENGYTGTLLGSTHTARVYLYEKQY